MLSFETHPPTYPPWFSLKKHTTTPPKHLKEPVEYAAVCDLVDLRVRDVDVREPDSWLDPPDPVDEVGHPKHVDPAPDHAVIHLGAVTVLRTRGI